MLVWKLWTFYTGMFAVTAILSCVIKIRGLFKSTKCGRLKMSNLKLSQPGVIPVQLSVEHLIAHTVCNSSTLEQLPMCTFT